jgi:uncharacterized membrane protein
MALGEVRNEALKKHVGFVTKMILGISLLMIVGCELLKPATAPPATQPTTQPAPKKDVVNDVAATVQTIATTAATVSPPGSPVQTGALITAAISGLVISANEMLKKLLAKKPPN